MEALIIDKYKAAPEWLYPDPRLREYIAPFKIIAALHKPAITRC